MRPSRIMKLVAQVSSSIKSSSDPASIASRILTAWEVDPLAEGVEKDCVDSIPGKCFMNPDRSMGWTMRPSSARILTAEGRVAMRSRPSPGTWGYTAVWTARSRVLLP